VTAVLKEAKEMLRKEQKKQKCINLMMIMNKNKSKKYKNIRKNMKKNKIKDKNQFQNNNAAKA